MSGQNSSQTISFWTAISHQKPVQLSYETKPDENFTNPTNQAEDGASKEERGSSDDKSKQELTEKEVDKTEEKNKETSKQSVESKYRFTEILNPYNKSPSRVSLSPSIATKLYEDANETFLIWKLKWNIPTITVKVTPNKASPTPDSTIANKLLFDVLLVESSKDSEKYNVIYDGIRGLTRKNMTNGLCQFKNLKMNRKGDTTTHQIMLLAFLVDEENPKNKLYYDIFVSQDIAIFTEGQIMQIDKLESLEQYFEIFDTQMFDKPPKPKIEGVDSETKAFQTYLFKKAVRIKNVVYLAYKFPNVLKLYGNAKIFKNQNGQLLQNISEIIHKEGDDIQLNAPLVANHLDPNAKLILWINCPSTHFKIMINKGFTAYLSIVVAENIKIPENFVMFDDIQLLKSSYCEYILKRQTEKKQESKPSSSQDAQQQDDESEEFEGESEESSNSYDDQGNITSNSDNLRAKKDGRGLRNRKEDDKKGLKKIVEPYVAPKIMTRKRKTRNQNAKEEESSFDENQEDDSARNKKPRIAVLNDMKKKKQKIKAKNQEKAKDATIRQGWPAATSAPMVPTGAVPFAPGMMMPFAQASPGKNAPCIVVDKKSVGQAYMMPFGQETQKDKPEAAKQSGNKPQMVGIPMRVGGMGGMGGMPSMSGITGMATMPGMGGMPGMGVAFMGPQGMQGIAGMQGVPGMQGMQGMQAIQGMPSNGSGMPYIQFAMNPQDFFKMTANQGKSEGGQDKASNDEHRNGGDNKKTMPDFGMIQGMPGMAGMPGMQAISMMPNMMNMSQMMPGQMPPGFSGMQIAGFPGGAMRMPPGMASGQSGQMGEQGVMPYIIMPGNPMASQSKPTENGKKQNQKDKVQKKDSKGPQTPEFPPGMFQMGGMMPNMMQLSGSQAGMLQGFMPNPFFPQQGMPAAMQQGQNPMAQGSFGSAGSQMPFVIGGQNGMFSMGGFPGPMMMGMPKPNEGQLSDKNKSEGDKSSTDKQTPRMPQGGYYMSVPGVPGMQPGQMPPYMMPASMMPNGQSQMFGQFGYPGGMSMAIPPSMMSGMNLPNMSGVNFMQGMGQRNDKKKDEQKK